MSDAGHPWSNEDPVSWMTLHGGEPVRAQDGTPIGRVTHPLGDLSEDIFDGVGFHPTHARRPVMAKAALVAAITRDAVYLSVGADQIDTLPPYEEEEMHKIGMAGFFRHHLGWINDRDR